MPIFLHLPPIANYNPNSIQERDLPSSQDNNNTRLYGFSQPLDTPYSNLSAYYSRPLKVNNSCQQYYPTSLSNFKFLSYAIDYITNTTNGGAGYNRHLNTTTGASIAVPRLGQQTRLMALQVVVTKAFLQLFCFFIDTGVGGLCSILGYRLRIGISAILGLNFLLQRPTVRDLATFLLNRQIQQGQLYTILP